VRAILDETGAIDHELRPGWPTARIAFVPDAVCWTQAPHTLAGLRTQRIRWQVGLLETMRLHIGMTGRRRFGAVGLLAFPYAFLEAFAAVVEVLGYGVAIALVVLEPSRWPYLVALFGVTILFGQMQSVTRSSSRRRASAATAARARHGCSAGACWSASGTGRCSRSGGHGGRSRSSSAGAPRGGRSPDVPSTRRRPSRSSL
jgi:hypothetical protein